MSFSFISSHILPKCTKSSGIISSATPNSFISSAVICRHSAASGASLASSQRILAQPSGEITEKTAFSSIYSLFATESPKAPPLPPSPMTIVIIGVSSPIICIRLSAIACPCPRSSASSPQNAPEVSTKQITGLWNFSACLIKRSALR